MRGPVIPQQKAAADPMASSKRKRPKPDRDDQTPSVQKKVRSEVESASSIPPITTFRPHESLIAQLDQVYCLKTYSVQSSTKMNKHIDKVLRHLDDTALPKPALVMLYAKSKVASKMISIMDVVRRRIAEADEKWYIYTALSEERVVVVGAEQEFDNEASVIGDTVLAGQSNNDDKEENEETIEALEITPFDHALAPAKVFTQAYMSIFLSRQLITELKALPMMAMQTNTVEIENRT